MIKEKHFSLLGQASRKFLLPWHSLNLTQTWYPQVSVLNGLGTILQP